MGGRASRQKGSRNELIIRDYFRSIGYEAHRVPCSGGAPGAKGDVRVVNGDKQILVEVKSRASEFSKLYAALDTTNNGRPIYMQFAERNAYIAYEFKDIPVPGWQTKDTEWNFVSAKPIPKVNNMFAFVKECDILVVKDDRRRPIFIKYLELKHEGALPLS